MEKTSSIGKIRLVLRNEITWIIFIVGCVWSFVGYVVLPLQKVQIQLAQVQLDISNNNDNIKQIMLDHVSFNTRLGVLETQIKPLLKQ